ncbi:ABC transporter substrate-binding protein [Streptomyces brasiliensis]|uniref:Branched-chain amino acid ABC transporter substrate-binding protein n=1 Tax=Streptomyces brasiliensis TaxID=1954 RepID=A0A917NYI9_9ACTN|nr:ABC transporter substrate-binding protein [Streptomyces brasiliensis]GGJ41139.1 branched-chain amino acid ABC transporter substrate-binding protein [Streptomyces brasiliensis]
MKRRLLSALAVSTLTLGSLAACGRSSSGSTAEGPIRIMSIGSFESPVFSTPQIATALRAKIAEINSNGGIDGRKVALETCNDKFDPNEATSCAQRAVSDGFVAVVGGASAFSPQFLPILEAAKIPLVAGSASSGAPELQSKISFPVNAGAPGMSIGNGRLAAEAGRTTVVIASDNEGSQSGADLAIQGASASGSKMTKVTMKLGAPDVSATVASSLELDPDAVSLQVVTEDALKLVRGFRQAGYEGLITGPGSNFPPASLKALGDFAEGVRMTSRVVPTTSTDIPQVREFLDQMAAEDPKAQTDDLALNAWTGMYLLAKVLKGHKITDGASVIAAFDDIKEPIVLGTAPDYPGIPAEPDSKQYPRVPVFATVGSTVKHGKIVRDGDFFNPLEGKD